MIRRQATRIRLIALTLSMIFPSISRAQFQDQTSGSNARLRGLSVASRSVAWAGGTEGTILRTIDGGKTWNKIVVRGAEGMDFRDVHAIDADVAWALSIGEGEKSRIYATKDGGRSWTLQYRGADPKVFLDAIAFWDDRRGIAMGDPLDGRHLVLVTDDGGSTWTRIDPEGLPAALPGEGAFAASGTCLLVQGKSSAWFATGSAVQARVFRSTDGGRNWTAHETPIRAGNPSSGIFSLAFRDDRNGVAVGGDYKEIGRKEGVCATTTDGGRTWQASAVSGPSGYRSGVAFFEGRKCVAVGPGGADVSEDAGRTWKPIKGGEFHAIGFASDGSGWGVGETGRIGKWVGNGQSK